MLTRKEREAVAGFRLWVKAMKEDDTGAMRAYERAWCDEDAEYSRQVRREIRRERANAHKRRKYHAERYQRMVDAGVV